MTADTILLDYLFSRSIEANDLGFPSHGKDNSMSQTIRHLEVQTPEFVVVWHMTIATGGVRSMTAALPSRIIRRHHMAIDTGFRRIGEVAFGVADLQGE
jgi:hypothetical protein